MHSEWIIGQDDAMNINAELVRDIRSPDDSQTIQLTFLQTLFFEQ